ncbi:MAG: hypothetical protein SH859_12410 [Hyphomicrobium aestuarii]|nr:hypothetical protein [Hyphomicrobium aestuarii]
MTRDHTAVLVAPKEAARLLGCSHRTLERHRRDGIGLPFFVSKTRDGTRLGRPTYLLSDVIEARDRGRVATYPRLKPANAAVRAKPAPGDAPLSDDFAIGDGAQN